MQYVGPVRQRKDVRQGAQKHRQKLNREEQPAEENHGEAEEVGECLSFKNLAREALGIPVALFHLLTGSQK